MVICPNCRRGLDDAPELSGQSAACPSCGFVFQMPHYPSLTPVVTHHHYHRSRKTDGMIAAILSLFLPGLGQMCQGRIGTGLLFLVLTIPGLVLCFLLLDVPLFCLLVALVVFVLWIWAVVDAANG